MQRFLKKSKNFSKDVTLNFTLKFKNTARAALQTFNLNVTRESNTTELDMHARFYYFSFAKFPKKTKNEF